MNAQMLQHSRANTALTPSYQVGCYQVGCYQVDGQVRHVGACRSGLLYHL